MYKFRYLQFCFVYLLEKNKKCSVNLEHSPEDKYTSSFCYFLINSFNEVIDKRNNFFSRITFACFITSIL